MNVPGIVLHASAEELLDRFLAEPTHAVLLGGAEGTGKSVIAHTLAATLLGTEQLENQAYYRAVVPKNGTITIEQVRSLLGFFQLKVPGAGAIKRVAVIEDADAMGTPAQNALLKLLEEPPADSVLILTSSHPQGLLPTIRSRTQLLVLPTPDTATLKHHFTQAGHSDQAISSALLRSSTNIAEAERLLSSAGETDDAINLVKQALGGSAYERLLLVDSLAKQKEAAHGFVDALSAVATASLQAAASRGAVTVERWKNISQAAYIAQSAFDRNANAKIVLTELMLAL